MISEKDKMLSGDFYNAASPEIREESAKTMTWLKRYNSLLDADDRQRSEVLKERIGTLGNQVVIRPPFHCDYGFNIHIGSDVFINFNCIILDVVSVSIGSKTMIGPGVQILSADHPREPEQREKGLEFGRPVAIGYNVWIGAGALILPGVTIGDHSIIAAGSVVTKDVPEKSVVAGNPARIVRVLV